MFVQRLDKGEAGLQVFVFSLIASKKREKNQQIKWCKIVNSYPVALNKEIFSHASWRGKNTQLVEGAWTRWEKIQ